MLALMLPLCDALSRVKLSKNGPEVSRIALGTLHVAEINDPRKINTWIHAALDQGITTFDFADVYGGPEVNIRLVGQALQLEPGLRNKMEIIAKMDVVSGGYDTSTEHLSQTLSDYLRLLNTSYVDVVLLHRQDYLTNATEVATLFKSWVASGKVRHVGTSNYDINSWNSLNRFVPLVTNQIEVSVWTAETISPQTYGVINKDNWYNTNNGLVDFHYANDVRVLAWGPLGGDPNGRTNRLFKQTGDRQDKIRQVLQKVGSELSTDEDIVALAWVLRHPAGIVPIIGTTNPDRIGRQVKAEGVANVMTRRQWYTIAAAAGLPLP